MINAIFRRENAKHATLEESWKKTHRGHAYLIHGADGNHIGTLTVNEDGREEYNGEPCCLRLDTGEEGPVILTDTMENAQTLASCGAGTLYIICGPVRDAVAAGLSDLSQEKSITLMSTCSKDGKMRYEDYIRQIIGNKTRLCLPPLNYRKKGSPQDYDTFSTTELDKDIENAAPATNPMLHSLAGVRRSNRYAIEKIRTPWQGLNAATYGGLPRGGVTCLCSKAGNGKSTLLLECLCGAVEQGHRAAVYSGEMADEDIVGVMTNQIAGDNYRELEERFGRYVPVLREDIAAEITDEVIAPAVMTIRDEYGTNAPWTSWQNAVTDAIVQQGIDVILVDNLMTLVTLITRERRCSQLEAQSIAANWLEHLAITYDVYVWLVAHLRKGAVTNDGFKNDAVSGASDVVNAASVVIFYEREEQTKKKDEDEEEDGDANSTRRIMSLTKNRLFGEVNYTGWTMDYHKPSQRTYQSNNKFSWQYETEWLKRKKAENS